MVRQIKTDRFGTLEVKESEIVTMPEGLYGFPELTEFFLLPHDTESPFIWLQSAQESYFAMVLVDWDKLTQDTHVLEGKVKVVLTIPTDARNMTANLKAPLVFNGKEAKQVILSQFQTKVKVTELLEKLRAA